MAQVRDANDARQNQALLKLAKLGQEGDDEAMRDVARTESGRRILYLHAVECGWRGSSWDASSARQTDFNAGLQQAGINLMGRFARCAPDEFMLALAEATKRDKDGELLRAAVAAAERDEEEGDDG